MGIIDKVLGFVLNKTDEKAKSVLDALTQEGTALTEAQDELEQANIKLRKQVKKSIKSLYKRDKAEAQALEKLEKLGL